jgi:hypothetical protein
MNRIILTGNFQGDTIIDNRIYTPSGEFIHKREIDNMWLSRQIRDVNRIEYEKYLKYLEDFNQVEALMLLA